MSTLERRFLELVVSGEAHLCQDDIVLIQTHLLMDTRMFAMTTVEDWIEKYKQDIQAAKDNEQDKKKLKECHLAAESITVVGNTVILFSQKRLRLRETG